MWEGAGSNSKESGFRAGAQKASFVHIKMGASCRTEKKRWERGNGTRVDLQKQNKNERKQFLSHTKEVVEDLGVFWRRGGGGGVVVGGWGCSLIQHTHTI